jgi:hypothetical protein
MGLIDDDFVQPFIPRKASGRYSRESVETQEERDKELNNLDLDELSKDFSDSPHLDY